MMAGEWTRPATFSPRTRIGLRFLLVLLIGSAIGSPAFAASPDEIDAALAELERENYQWELPVREEEPTRPRRSLGLPLARILGFAVIGLVLIVGTILLVNYLRERGALEVEDEVSDGASGDDEPSVALSDRPLAAARAAAEQGRFEEAIHLLLLGTIAEIRASLGYDAPPWLTSRQILRRAPLPDAGRTALEGIVGAVERSHFGGRSAGEEEFAQCVAWHRELRAACSAGRKR